ncbi:hypothetical protein GCM10022631_41020 [Deinococcus rubellus]|uniref:Uncharacterized protein n=1 Tax=Deinococcus rubellus TaxID=1889240 RepID=A0ABY5YFM7_9DEIO|nr:hypothetical protein [Deinococcus rubellus]UWX63890.1 hypothetical protein N0D28_14365 [Deinococcus rubellus]
MTGPKRPAKKSATKQPASRRGGAKSARELSKVGPSRPGGPSKDRRSAEGRSGAKASDARQTARPTASGLGGAGHTDTRQARDNYQDDPRRPGQGPGRPKSGETQSRTTGSRGSGFRGGSFKGTAPKKTGPRGAAIGVDLAAPAPETVFRDLDGAEQRFPDSNLKRVAARLLGDRHKPWRYRPFPFPLFTDKGQEQTFYFDFYVYDNMDMILKLILVAPRESAEVWDKVGRFKRQYPMYSYELWTPDKLAQLQKPRTQLNF